MKKITQLFIICTIAVIMAISVSAATVTLDLNAYDEANDQYMLAVNYQADGGDAAIITVKFDFNSEKLILADTSFEAIADIANAKGTPLYFPEITSGSGLNKKTAQWGIVNEETGAQWSVNGNKVSAYITAELPEAGMSIFDDATGYEAFDVLFNLADGVTPESLTDDDFSVTSVFVSDLNLGELGYNIEGKAALTVVNNVVSEPADIPVMSETTELYYRADDRKGVLYTASFASTLKTRADEYGVLVLTQSDKIKAEAEEAGVSLDELNMDLVDAGIARKCVSFNKNTDIYYNETEGVVNFKVAVTGVPLYEEAVVTTVVVRPYYTADGVTVYGEPVETNLYTVAKSVSNNEIIYDALKTEVRDFIDTVVGLVENG